MKPEGIDPVPQKKLQPRTEPLRLELFTKSNSAVTPLVKAEGRLLGKSGGSLCMSHMEGNFKGAGSQAAFELLLSSADSSSLPGLAKS